MRTGVPADCVGNFHEAGFYASDEEFLALITPFATEGVTAGEPVIFGYDAHKSGLLRATLPWPDAVTFIDTRLYATPASAIEAYRRLFERHVTAGAQQIRIAGDVPHEGNGGRFEGWDRYESAVNAVWQDYPVRSRCLYDATTVPDRVRDVVERTHPRLVRTDGSLGASPRFQDVSAFDCLPPTTDPLEAGTPGVHLLDASLKQTRRRVADAARGRVDDATYEDLIFAVSEAVINAQLYGRPPIAVRIWSGDDRIVVRVRDAGPGPTDALTGLVPDPGGGAGSGLGLWLAHQLPTIDIALIAGAEGFTVRLRAGRPAGPADGAGDIPRLPVGTSHGAPRDPGGAHVVDGDGSSLCGLVEAADLDRLDGISWPEVPATQQCSCCRLLVVPPADLLDPP